MDINGPTDQNHIELMRAGRGNVCSLQHFGNFLHIGASTSIDRLGLDDYSIQAPALGANFDFEVRDAIARGTLVPTQVSQFHGIRWVSQIAFIYSKRHGYVVRRRR
ncbi:MAG: hypothetical protein ABT05_03335 [Lautropia sp. SCN 66-9]|nr:MAG: hypothetical protein ABT05_03335 [Lautropia sp. SCN 66-9]